MKRESETKHMTPGAKRAWRLVKRYSIDGPQPRMDLYNAAVGRFDAAGGFNGKKKK